MAFFSIWMYLTDFEILLSIEIIVSRNHLCHINEIAVVHIEHLFVHMYKNKPAGVHVKLVRTKDLFTD